MRNKVLLKINCTVDSNESILLFGEGDWTEYKGQHRWQSTAIFTLQNGAEDYMVRLFNDANLCTIQVQRQMIMPHDIQLA